MTADAAIDAVLDVLRASGGTGTDSSLWFALVDERFSLERLALAIETAKDRGLIEEVGHQPGIGSRYRITGNGEG